MNETVFEDWFASAKEDPARYDPVRSARGAMVSRLPKRFYKEVTTGPLDGVVAVLLDGRPARTKGRHVLGATKAEIADLLASEWAAQGESIDPTTMPATRILHAALDHVAQAMAEVRADIVKYAGSDLVCYRADGPDALVQRQNALWNPVLAHAEARYAARFALAEGIMFVAQPPEAIGAVARRVEMITDVVALAALHVLTTISGSALIAIAVADGALAPEAAFDAGELDADYEASVWGDDEEAQERRAARRTDFLAAAMLLTLAQG